MTTTSIFPGPAAFAPFPSLAESHSIYVRPSTPRRRLIPAPTPVAQTSSDCLHSKTSRSAVSIMDLPTELLVMIVDWLDPASLLDFTMTCKGMRCRVRGPRVRGLRGLLDVERSGFWSESSTTREGYYACGLCIRLRPAVAFWQGQLEVFGKEKSKEERKWRRCRACVDECRRENVGVLHRGEKQYECLVCGTSVDVEVEAKERENVQKELGRKGRDKEAMFSKCCDECWTRLVEGRSWKEQWEELVKVGRENREYGEDAFGGAWSSLGSPSRDSVDRLNPDME